jgi:putative addiction module component (TIGR02574 family)
MSVDRTELLALSALEKLEIIEMLWDDLGSADREIPLPDWVDQEVVRRREELIANPEIGLTHEEVWSRIGSKY